MLNVSVKFEQDWMKKQDLFKYRLFSAIFKPSHAGVGGGGGVAQPPHVFRE